MTTPPALRVAIIGAGSAGLSLAHALSFHANIVTTVYEAAPKLREEGANLALGYNAQIALSMISPQLREALDKAGGTIMDLSVRLMMGTGPHKGEKIADVVLEKPQIVVHRTRLLKEVMALVPDSERIVRFGMKIGTLNEGEGGTVLKFENGEIVEADCVVGCDGLNSIVRPIVLGGSSEAPLGNGYNFINVVPIERAIEVFGKDYCAQAVQTGWVGEDGFCLTDLSDNGEMFQAIAGWAPDEPWPHSKPYVSWPKDKLRSQLKEWGDFGTKLGTILTDQETLVAANLRRHSNSKTYSRGRVCVVGDAAQAMAPFLGAGAGQAVEDVLVLSSVLANSSAGSIPQALSAYTQTRLPRRQNICEGSLRMAAILCGKYPGVGLDPTKIKEALPGSWDFSQPGGFDHASAIQDAITLMQGM